MSVANIRATTLVLIFLMSISGCNYFQNAASDDDSDLADLDDSEKIELTSKPNAEASKEKPLEEAQLELKLRVGDQFPLTKTIEQRLTQTDSGGVSVSNSQTELTLSLVVEKIQPDGMKLMSVRYHRVRYLQDIRGKNPFIRPITAMNLFRPKRCFIRDSQTMGSRSGSARTTKSLSWSGSMSS